MWIYVPLHGIIIFTGIIHQPLHVFTSCVCNKSDLIGTLASVIVLTGQTCGDCHLIIELAIQSFWVSVNSTSPYFIWSFIRRSLQFLQSRMSMPRDNTRARREGRQPRYLDDFLLELPRRHLLHTIPDQAVGGAISPSHEDTDRKR